MKCPECGSENKSDYKFCGYCGGALGDVNISALFEGAFKSEARGDLDKALQFYKRLLEKRPESQEVLFKIGMVYYDLGCVDQAVEMFERIIGRNPKFIYAYFRLGLCRYQKCMIEEAIQAYSAALATG